MLHAKDLMDVDRSTLFMVDQNRGCMYTVVADNADPITIPLTSGLAGAAYQTGKVVNVPDAYQDDRFNRDIDQKNGYRTKSVLCYPIQNSRDEVIAVIQIINKHDGLRFNALDEELIAAFCAQLAVSIENVLAIDDMNKSSALAARQQQRMRNFLDVCGMMVQGLPAHEICEKAQSAAMACTDSNGAVFFICPDNAPEVLSATRLDLDAIDSMNKTADEGASSSLVDEPSASAGEQPAQVSFTFRPGDRKKDKDPDDDLPDLTQLVPPVEKACWPAVSRFCASVIMTNTTLEDAVDLTNRSYLDNDKFTLFNIYQVKTSTSGLRFCGYNNTTQIRRGIKKDKLMHSRSHQVTSRAYHVGGAAPTLTTSGNVIIYDGRGFRYLTIEELYTIQGFPPTFKRCGNITQSKHQIGNSVSPKVVRAIALSLL